MLRRIKRIIKRIRSCKLKTTDFSIICNNCWGGLVYSYFGLPYKSPTIGLVIPPSDFNRFCSDVKRYSTIPLKQLFLEESNNKDLFTELEKIHGKLVYGIVDDVEICFLHYGTFDEANEKWQRRFKRVNFNKLIFKNNDNNFTDGQKLDEWFEVVKNKESVFITNNDNYLEIAKKYSKIETIFYNESLNHFSGVNDTSSFFKKKNIAKIINSLL